MSASSERPKILVIAEAANPEWVSVPLVGWSLASALREVADVHIVTQIRNRDSFLRAGMKEGTDFTAIDSEAIAKPMHKLANLLRMGSGKGWTMTAAINAVSYPYFEKLVWERFGSDILAKKYDLVHRITPVSPAIPSPIASKIKLAGIPFVVGPLNGGVPWPKGFAMEGLREGEWLSYLRDVYKLNPLRRKMLHSASAILVGSQRAATEIPKNLQDRIFWLPENAIDTSRFNLISSQNLDGPLRACFIGRFVPCKGIDMLLNAAAPLLSSGKLVLDIIGDGPLRKKLEDQTKQLGIELAVTFHGNLPHTEVQKVAVQSNLLTFPSIREFGGGVILEAMALGVVPLVVDYAGPGELVTDETGYKIPLGSREEITARMNTLLNKIIDDPSDLPMKAEAARKRIHTHFTWQAKAEQISRIYDWVLKNGDRPVTIPER